MKHIEKRFNDTFSKWNICLPQDALEQCKRGKIVQAGWAIWYLVGSDITGCYMDYYAAHRMTDDRHVRIHADGSCENLPAIHGTRLKSDDLEEDRRLETEFITANAEVSRLLDAKGFNLNGDEPGGVQINRFLKLIQKTDVE